MEDLENEDFREPASGVYQNIDQYLEDRFNFPNSGQDPVEIKQPATGFDSYLAERFGK